MSGALGLLVVALGLIAATRWGRARGLLPAGVALARRDAEGRRPWLRPDDVVEVEITGLGRQRNELV